mmetsp:Transcript_3750/g.14031  ORF Transcript_3750/g.14031 Transcript_3750/m.14031 type:complete len:307 (-) Transcript_3750:994-1914(-)
MAREGAVADHVVAGGRKLPDVNRPRRLVKRVRAVADAARGGVAAVGAVGQRVIVVRGLRVVVGQRALVDVDALVRRSRVVHRGLSNRGDVNIRQRGRLVADAASEWVDLDAHDDAAADDRGRLRAVAVAAAEGDGRRIHVTLAAVGHGDVRDVALFGRGANRVVGAQRDHRRGAVPRRAAHGGPVEVTEVIRGSDELKLVVGGSQTERRVEPVALKRRKLMNGRIVRNPASVHLSLRHPAVTPHPVPHVLADRRVLGLVPVAKVRAHLVLVVTSHGAKLVVVVGHPNQLLVSGFDRAVHPSLAERR